MIVVALAIAYAFVNYARGRGLLPEGQHAIAAALWAVVTGASAAIIGYPAAYVAAITFVTFIGMGFWVVWGWGLYFSAYHGLWAEYEREIRWIDWIGKKLVPWRNVNDIARNRLRGTICMSLRGLYLMPLFWLLSAPSLGLVGLAMGPAYGIMRYLPAIGRPLSEGTKWAEPLFAAIVGAAVGYKLTLGF